MRKRKTLSTVLAEDLTGKVMSGALEPGARLPTEAELCREYGVSRTVVREAVARLRSDGLLLSYQGKGMFVAERMPAQKFEIDEQSLCALPETISLLELRLSVEVEAAALCAVRRSAAAARKIRKVMEQVDERRSDPSHVAVHYDFAFHISIAEGSGNPFFLSFLRFLEPIIIPRFRLGALVSEAFKDRYYEKIHGEHEAVVLAIEGRRPDAAREAMRAHLLNSLERFRAFSRAAGVGMATGVADPAAMRPLEENLFKTLGADAGDRRE
ncbi:MAG: FadR/GntR family transcriptional regulator [Pikeienuella sp.]